MRNENGVNLQINSRPMEIIICLLKQELEICVVDEFHLYESNYVPDLRLTLGD